MTAYDDSRRGATFRRLDLSGAVFDDTYLTGARFKNVDLRRAVFRGSLLLDVEISGEVERTRMHPTDPAAFREAWDVLERRWSETVERARRLEAVDPDLLHERVDGEWSFVETLRHLVFATDAWIGRALLGDPSPWSPLDLPHDDMADIPEVPRDRDVRPSLDEVLELRRDRMATMRRVVEGLTQEQLADTTTPVTEPGYPEPEAYPVQRVVGCIVNEEWHHHQYATRDLAVLESRLGSPT
jgi:uncharacterized protein YjbI with pentapeptide repeats